MELPLQISFRQMEHSPSIEATIREKAAHLDKFAGRLMSCRVVIQPAGKHHLHGNQYEVHIDVKLPGGEVVASRDPGQHKEYRDIAIAIRDAFDAVARQIEDYVRRQRGDVKPHATLEHARVSKLEPAGNYGFLSTPEGREIYFHQNSVLHDAFDQLELGSIVAFAEQEGDQGPQATVVKVIDQQASL
jgi:cold shock CspA family protein